MSRADRIRPAALPLLGVLGAAAALALAMDDAAALAGWLAAFTFFAGLPLGGLVLVMMMRLIPGRWREALGLPAEAMLLLLPLAILCVLPVLLGAGLLYVFPDDPAEGVFRAFYRTPSFFVLRTGLFFLLAGGLALLLLRRPGGQSGLASAGLIVFVLADSAIAFDWLMAVDRDFHSSGFGLYVLSIQGASALALAMLVRLRGPSGEDRGMLGALLLTALLLWAYLAFLQYFISWSDDLPPIVRWYQVRAEGVWSAIEYAIGALGLVPILLLLFPPVRRSTVILRWLAAATLVGKALETAWLVLPAFDVGARAAAAAVLAFGALAALSVAGLSHALPYAERLRAARRDATEAAS